VSRKGWLILGSRGWFIDLGDRLEAYRTLGLLPRHGGYADTSNRMAYFRAQEVGFIDRFCSVDPETGWKPIVHWACRRHGGYAEAPKRMPYFRAQEVGLSTGPALWTSETGWKPIVHWACRVVTAGARKPRGEIWRHTNCCALDQHGLRSIQSFHTARFCF
jgi:hypothetical protein